MKFSTHKTWGCTLQHMPTTLYVFLDAYLDSRNIVTVNIILFMLFTWLTSIKCRHFWDVTSLIVLHLLLISVCGGGFGKFTLPRLAYLVSNFFLNNFWSRVSIRPSFLSNYSILRLGRYLVPMSFCTPNTFLNAMWVDVKCEFARQPPWLGLSTITFLLSGMEMLLVQLEWLIRSASEQHAQRCHNVTACWCALDMCETDPCPWKSIMPILQLRDSTNARLELSENKMAGSARTEQPHQYHL